MPAVELQTGSWVVESKAVGFLVKKGKDAKAEYSFWVATAEASCEDCTFWESKLKTAGVNKEGQSKFKLTGHPHGGFFVKVGDDTFSEVDADMKERNVWKYKADIKGKFLTSIAAPPQRATNFPTDNFSQAVLYKDPSRNEPCSPPIQVIVEACGLANEQLPEDPLERQRLLANYYTSESPLYHEMNKCLRDDDLNGLRYYSAYIKELRDVFKTDHKDQIIEPFVGKVWRGIGYPDPEAALKDFAVGETFVWSAFTSMTTERDVAFRFGNIVFEVSCLPPKEAYEGATAVYAPASVSGFSDFAQEAEILFPPNVQFQVKEIKMPGGEGDDAVSSPLIICETVAFDSDEGLKEFKDFKAALDSALADGTLDNTPAEERAKAIQSGYKRLFDAIDANKSLTLSKKEARAALTKIQGAVSYAGAAFPGISLPGEGKGVIRKYVDEMFEATDMNKDGTLTFDELFGFIASKQGSPEAMADMFTKMSVQDWTSMHKTLETIVQAFENSDFSSLASL
uniref:EF-hand domain-containing protein n=1 Tax=Alexandrium catenella TaxID=2925 RepID=A0A7S1Q1K2_ALECA